MKMADRESLSGVLVVFVKQQLYKVQRIYIPTDIESEFSGKYASVKLSNGEIYFCRIFTKESLRKGFCLIDKTVSIRNSDNNPARDNDLSISSISVTNTIKYIKTVYISLVFNGINERGLWVRNNRKFFHLLKGVLKLFVLCNSCIVSLVDLKELSKLGINLILVNSIGNISTGKVVESTIIQIEELISLERYQQVSIRNSIEIAGMDQPYKCLYDFIKCRESLHSSQDSIKHSMSQVLVVGPAGTGKKTLIQKVSNDCEAVLIKIDSTELTKPQPGESESILREKFQYAISLAEEGLVILLLLYSEATFRKKGKLLCQFNSLLDSIVLIPNLIVMATTSSPDNLHESLRSSSRLHYQINIDIPNELDRIEMLKLLCKYESLNDEYCSDVASLTPGYVIADLALLAKNTSRQLKQKKLTTDIQNYELLVWKKNVALIEPSCLRGELGVIKKNQLEQNQLGGLDNIKDAILKAVLWPQVHRSAFERMNIKQCSGILLYGPPGCAKTSLAKSIATNSNHTFLAVSAADLYSPYVGDAERTINNLFYKARTSAPSILFIDEIDALAGRRAGKQKGAQDRILSTFLIEMDGIGNRKTFNQSDSEVMVIAATNRPQVLDSALLRPRRFDKIIYVPPPTIDGRREILQILTKRMPLGNDFDLGYLTKKTECFSGADLTNLCREAAFNAINECGSECNSILQKHWLSALKETAPSLSKEQLSWYEKYSLCS